MQDYNLIVLTGVSGSGKDTLLSFLYYDLLSRTSFSDKELEQARIDFCASVEIEFYLIRLLKEQDLIFTKKASDNLKKIIGHENLPAMQTGREQKNRLIQDIKRYALPLRKKLEKELPLALILSWASRPIRNNEIPDLVYHFVTNTEFESAINRDEFLEYATVYNTYKGTPLLPVIDTIKNKRTAIKLVDPQGSVILRELDYSRFPVRINPFIVFVDCPEKVMEERMRLRATDTEEQIRLRLATAQKERLLMEHRIKPDLTIKNISFYDARKAFMNSLIDAGIIVKSYKMPKRYEEYLKSIR